MWRKAKSIDTSTIEGYVLDNIEIGSTPKPTGLPRQGGFRKEMWLARAIKRDASTLRFWRVFLLANSEILADKIAAYQATRYRVGSAAAGFTLCIGQSSHQLQKLYLSTGQCRGVFITAFNPFGRAQGDEENEAAHLRLGDDLRTTCTNVIEGDGVDPEGLWPAEKSYFALGVDEEKACVLGRRWRQDAVVWVGADAVPRLILLR